MTASSKINGEEVRTPVFVQNLYRQWTKAENPRDIMVDTNIADVAIHPTSSLNIRLPLVNDEETCVWSFEITIIGKKKMTNIVLAHDYDRANFTITSVVGELVYCPDIYTQIWEHNGPHEYFDSMVNVFTAEVLFRSTKSGTYRQDVLFVFSEGPIIRKQLCVDCVSIQEVPKLDAAAEYIENLYNRKSNTNIPVCRFESEYVPSATRRELCVESTYPEPKLKDFFLTHCILQEDGLSPQNYRGRLHELLYVEELARRELISRYNEVVLLRLTKSYALMSEVDKSTTTKYPAPGELFAQLPLSREVSEDTKSGRLLLRSCQKLLIRKVTFKGQFFADPEFGPEAFEANIESKCSQSIYIRLPSKCVDALELKQDTDVHMYIQFAMARLPFCEWHRAIDSLLDPRILFPSKQLDQKIDFKWCAEWESSLQRSKLNKRQKEAVALMMAPRHHVLPPILILGPFGTGKTSTIAQALKILLLNDHNSKIVLCTHSNSAADLYVKDYFNKWYEDTGNPRLKPLRIYYKGRARNTVHPTVRRYSTMDEAGFFCEPSLQVVESAGLIITTLTTSSCLIRFDLNPTHVIIDEAAQALECESLNALALAKPSTRMILAGDQMQLAPEIYGDLPRDSGLGLSLLERIHRIYEPNHPCRIQLCLNYRAHPDIVKFTSEAFYKGEIESGVSVPRHPFIHPLTFYAVEGKDVQGINSTGYINNAEAYQIAERVADLKLYWPEDRWGPYGENSIGVLAHYADQVVHIRNELRKRRLFDVSVERVMNVQGKQFTAVFISVVRSSSCSRHSANLKLSDYGFLTDARLLNTAVTRAKSLVAVFGDPAAMLVIGSCTKLWESFLDKAHLFGVNDEELSYRLRKILEEPAAAPLNPLAEVFVPRPKSPDTSSYWLEYVPMGIRYPVIHCEIQP